MISIQELTDRGFTAYLRGDKKTPFILYTGLIILAHEKGLQSIETEAVLMDWDNGRFVFKATVTGKDGQVFTEYGDATTKNVGKNIVPHAMRMALTRSKARALRDFTGLGLCTKEELEADDSDFETSMNNNTFLHEIKLLGLTYEAVAQFCIDKDRPEPSKMSSDNRKKLLLYLQQNKI